MTRTTTRRIVVGLLVLGTTLCMLRYPTPTSLYEALKRVGVIPSYTERVYTIGDRAPHELRYVPLGDSLSAGVGAGGYRGAFPYRLGLLLHTPDTRVLVQPHAIPGATTADALEHLLSHAVAVQPDVVTILLGVNDVHKYVPRETFEQNYRTILETLRSQTTARVYVVNIPWIGASELFSPDVRQALDARTREFNAVLRELASTYGVVYVDLYTATEPLLETPGYYARDRFHPSSEGYAHWATIMHAAITR